ncbi:hypothetical protein DID88_009119 [Monilinia fructigena]|uniref:Uncharacterized protein n=1 Tax=Monilinia fructigena TaxID=38457 RepID=A0A395IK88_9HELO|nr:hypothetical protein DID88_009119 [Monilinia fructigena]
MDTAVAGAPIPSYEELRCKYKAYRAMSYLPYTQPQPKVRGWHPDTHIKKPTTILQKAQGLDHASAEKIRIRNRNQYQWTAALERAAELDAERDLYRCPRRTFSPDAPEVHKSRASQRPMSMGDLLGWQEKEAPKEMRRDKNDRHDWTQRDESEEVRRSMRERVGPLLSLRLRKEKVNDGAVEEIKIKSPVKSPLRVSFFGRFKRSFSNGT